MPLTPPQTIKMPETDAAIRNPEPVLDAHTEWFARVMRWSFYPEDPRSQTPIQAPENFIPWLDQIREDRQANPQTIAALLKLYQELRQTADDMVALSTSGKPPIEKFDYFIDLYDEFTLKMRRLGWDCLLSESGIDALTGFRSFKVMFPDLERELDRRNRRGRPFCVAYLRIDAFDPMTAAMDLDATENLIRKVSDIMKLCMRTYDDAYRYGPGEIVWSLKHSDIAGGTRAIERLRRMIEDEDISVTLDGKQKRLSLSCIVSEPVPGDVLPEVLEQMRNELLKYADEPNVVLRHKEISRLQLFIDQSEDTSPQTESDPSDLS